MQASGGTPSLTQRRPVVPPDRLLAELVPPRHFADESFATYRPDPAHPSQAGRASTGCRSPPRRSAADRRGRGSGGARSTPGRGLPRRRVRRRQDPPARRRWRTRSGSSDAAYGTFVEYTNLVGALGFLPTVEALATRRLVCIDEFELDDPGDTVLMSRLLRELADRGVALAATSNTLPGSLGEGRFAAEDFLREIQALAARFEVLRVDGEDYRHRAVATDAAGPARRRRARGRRGARRTRRSTTSATCSPTCATVHPSRYGALLDGVGARRRSPACTPCRRRTSRCGSSCWSTGSTTATCRCCSAGRGSRACSRAEMLAGGYRKKYYRALSRLGSLAADGAALVG